MSASSVTGRGFGASFGKYKPDNNCGGCHCSCGNKCPATVETIKIGCYTRTIVGGAVVRTVSTASPAVKVCS